MKVNLGCGHAKLEGYVNVDMHPNADVRCDVLALPEEWTGKASEAIAIHILEHLPYYETQKALLEWRRILCPGGILIIECPNLREACLAYLKDPGKYMWGLHPIYGDQSPGDILSVHKSGWTPETLVKELHAAGFREARQAPAQFKRKEPRDFRVEAVK